jgi:hypothetical protein
MPNDYGTDFERTVVMFRKWPEREGGDVIALFPYVPADDYGLYCQSFMHLGQHARANLGRVIEVTRPATPDEYAALRRELESPPYGYRLAVRLRTPHDASEVRRQEVRRP